MAVEKPTGSARLTIIPAMWPRSQSASARSSRDRVLSNQTPRWSKGKIKVGRVDASPSPTSQPVPVFQFLARGDPAGGDDVCEVSLEPAERGGSAVQTRDRWRTVDQEGEILEIYVTKTRDKKAALRFMKKALKRDGRTEAIVTDGLRSYPAAIRELGNLDRREMGRWLNNRAENSHLPFRRRERALLRFRQMKSLQKFAPIHAHVHNHFNLERHLIDRQTYTIRLSASLAEWQTFMV